MIQALLAVGVLAFIAEAFSEEEKENPSKAKRSKTETKSKKLFISFAIEDAKYRNFLVAQAKNERSPFTFVDMSVKQPWDEKIWKQKCREKIKQCDGMIVLLSKNTWHSGGSRWEITCAKEEKIPVIGMHIRKNDKGAIPPELSRKKVINWSWDKIDDTINKF
jgi:hypothetical protein